jgi:drug/metabolite transporter (DMT)-like permease
VFIAGHSSPGRTQRRLQRYRTDGYAASIQADASYAPRDWGLLAGIALMWGSSFLFIDIGVDHLSAGLVAAVRLAFGATTLAVIPIARHAVPREAWPGIALLGITWMAIPFVLFAVAEQSIDSSLAGMLNAAAPLFTALVAALVARRLPVRRQAIGLAIGFAGVVVISLPALGAAHATALGVCLVIVATMLYGIAFNLAPRLESRHGALPVIWRAQLVALVVVAPLGVVGISDSEPAWSSLLAVAALGSFGTALAFVAFTMLTGRVGPTGASVAIYFLPVVAILLGALTRDESIAAVALPGTALVLAGAYLTSRGNGDPSQEQHETPKT